MTPIPRGFNDILLRIDANAPCQGAGRVGSGGRSRRHAARVPSA